MSIQQEVDKAVEPDDEGLFQAALEAARKAPRDDVEAALKGSSAEEKAPEAVEPTPAVEKAPEAAQVESNLTKIKKLMAFEAEKREFDTKRKQIESEYENMKREYEAVQQFKQRFAQDPAAAIKSVAGEKDLADVAKQLWYESLGAEAPPEYRAKKEGRETLSLAEQKIAEFEERQRRLVEEQARYQQEAAVNQYRGALAMYAEKVPETYQLTGALAKSDPQRVSEVMFKIAQDHARRTGGEVLTPEQTVKALEEKLSGFKAIVAPEKPAPEPAKQQAAPTSLRNRQTTNQTTRAVEDDLDDEALYKRALAAAKAVRE